MILAIDPGNIESAYVIMDNNLKPIEFGKVGNKTLRLLIAPKIDDYQIYNVAIEMVASYGMPVGAEVFETVFWIGRFYEMVRTKLLYKDIKKIYRKEECLNLCNSPRANDSNIIQALVDRFAYGVPNKGKGIVNKKVNQPGWFYGFSKDIWQAYAVGVTYHDLYLKEESK